MEYVESGMKKVGGFVEKLADKVPAVRTCVDAVKASNLAYYLKWGVGVVGVIAVALGGGWAKFACL